MTRQNRRLPRLHALVLALGISGCSYPPMDLPVTGVVTLDGKPLAGTSLFFIPTDKNKHIDGLIGQAHTASDGRFTLENTKGEKAFYQGEFKVTFTRYETADGKPIPMTVKPDDVGATQVLPVAYVHPDTTPIVVDVSRDNHKFKFELHAP